MTDISSEYRLYGSSGAWVTLLHGGPGAPGHLEPVARRLATGFRVLEPFERRSGEVPLSVAVHVQDLDLLLRRVTGQDRSTVVGFSSGAVTALTFAARHPERVSKVVVIGSATFSTAARLEFKARLNSRMDGGGRERLRQVDMIANLGERIRERAQVVIPFYMVDPMDHPRDVWLDASGHEQTWRDMLRLQDIGQHPGEFHTIRAPVLMLHGRDDPHPGELIKDSLTTVLPELHYIELAHCGHYPWLERQAAAEFYRILEQWLRLPA